MRLTRRLNYFFGCIKTTQDDKEYLRPVIQNGVTYKILSMEIDKKNIIRELLFEMAIRPFGLYIVHEHHLTPNEKKRILEYIKSDFDLIIEQINVE